MCTQRVGGIRQPSEVGDNVSDVIPHFHIDYPDKAIYAVIFHL